MLYIPCPFKRCSKCHQEYPATLKYFRRKKENISTGLHSWCRQCGRNDHHRYQREHPENTLYWKSYWQKTHPQQYSKTKRKSYLKHRTKVLKDCKAYRETEQGKRVSAAGAAKHRARKMNAEGIFTKEDVQAQYKRQKGKCYYCGCDLGNKYHVDHVVPLSRGGANSPDNLVITCPTCNLRKNDRLPHEWPDGGRLC